MCGICGFIKTGRRVQEEDARIIKAMNAKLVHRGPDAQDTLLFDNIALGFSRLSIIGLENGMQPVSNEDGSVIMICNGEIFNYIELKAALIKRGHTFRTLSDVEVIVHLYEEEGMAFLNQLNGQFAFALYDKRKRILCCARDQMGILPLYYTRVEEQFIFASEIKAILEHPKVVREVDRVGLDQVFTFPGLISPRTMFKNIHSLENGHYITVDDDGVIRDTEYWDLEYPEGEVAMNGKSENYYINELEALFETSIKLRMRADVPTGFYLSGGLDSSMILLKAHQLFPDMHKQAFSIDFVESQLSESTYQQLVSKESNAVLNQQLFFYDDISKRLQHSVYHSECPIKETYNTASISLSESVRNKGIKVIQSGEGADEFFAGYVGYRFDKMRAMNLVKNESSPEEIRLRQELWDDPDFFYERNFLEFDQVKKSLYSAALRDDYAAVNCLNYPVVNKKRLVNRSQVSKRAYIDYKLRLVDHLVSDHGDRMALANSVEVRYPFMDKTLVEYSARLPASLKINGFTEKYILKKMGSRFMPTEIFEREKFHFVAPGSPYLLQRNIEYINDLLSYDLIRKQGFFNPDEIERLKKMYAQEGFTINAPYESDLLITVITFGILLDTFFN
ncbi:asparagine synthase (glutamine-hydrolyzing) [Chitinophaga nivalis]|uniref:asparagine synthase (glutamine-hydrolyzing) n=1 Tax=Chitinophaga nivalis TaxID=2991709 RepID=A0ABT3IKD0_9BACT|nr:asparagine synthase (glutamine-hydrolyzing) [Chitinophaga nivalis]MCW3466085.1 asparagine synthase (glutamine-hydrolyzing) [Chitinophaga nivalis]MCW3484224.1 asparagine synthase (glutamine-hydrolyzing) [Chitinophaga nivalis]